MSERPIQMRWQGDGFTPLGPYWSKQADAAFVIGEVYSVITVEERSEVSHNHEFAWLNEAFKTLPEDLHELYPSVEHLRKRALIQGGFYHETIVDAGSNAAALRVASAFRAKDEFMLVIVRGPLVVMREAESQKKSVMGKERFQASKTKIMEIVSDLLKVKPDELQRARAA